MNFTYKVECNISIGQKLYGIIAVSRYTYDGVYPIIVNAIDYNNECVIFRVDQPCGYVFCSFDEMKEYVFETWEEAENAIDNIEFGAGLQSYSDYF